MVVIVLEALGALLLLLGIVWWTMFAGRRRGERVAEADPAPPGSSDEKGLQRRQGGHQ